MSGRILLLLLLCVVGEARADGTVADAERVRLSVEMERLASRQAWNGVERKYIQLMELGIELEASDHLHGAHSARELGDIQGCHDRLRRVIAIDATREVVDWLWDIDNNYGHVVLRTGSSRAAVLERMEIPFDPNQRRAIETAIERAREDASFSGLLPTGDYVFAGQQFQVSPGVSVTIDISARVRRQGLVEPVIVYHDRPARYLEQEGTTSGEESGESAE